MYGKVHIIAESLGGIVIRFLPCMIKISSFRTVFQVTAKRNLTDWISFKAYWMKSLILFKFNLTSTYAKVHDPRTASPDVTTP